MGSVHRGGQQKLGGGFSAMDGGVSKDSGRKATVKEARPGAASKRNTRKIGKDGIGSDHPLKPKSGIGKTLPFDMPKTSKTPIPSYKRAPQS